VSGLRNPSEVHHTTAESQVQRKEHWRQARASSGESEMNGEMRRDDEAMNESPLVGVALK
jgi:hypothetical protein